MTGPPCRVMMFKTKILDEKEWMIVSNDCNEQRTAEAKESELENWRNFGIYEEVANEGQNSISVRWVCTEKQDSQGKTFG